MSSSLKPTLARLATGKSLSEEDAEHAFGLIMAGEATPAQIGALLMALRVRGETVAELTGAVRAMRARMIRVVAPPGAVDVCGTGGDGAGTLNISTAVTFVLAGLGVPVAKHGNRALSSRTGGADVLAALGIDVDVPLERLPHILRAANCAFLFAPRHHAALRHAAGPRIELGTRTIFNLLGPLANPAEVKRQLIGVFDPAWAHPMAAALAELGSEILLDRARAGTGRADARRREQRRGTEGRRGPDLRRDTGASRLGARTGCGDPGRRRRRERHGACRVARGSRRAVS